MVPGTATWIPQPTHASPLPSRKSREEQAESFLIQLLSLSGENETFSPEGLGSSFLWEQLEGRFGGHAA